jgi:triacylglycerol lipase
MSNQNQRLVLDPTAPHSTAQAAFLGKACELAYRPAEVGRQGFAEQLGMQAQLISVGNTQAYVATDPKSIVVAFRGSESLATLDGFRDWLLTNARNFLVLPEGRLGTDFAAAGVGARFHSGFMKALGDIWDTLFPVVDEAFNASERAVWVTGHSLGGAIALLCGWRFHQNFVPVHQICTFGAPMIGNDAAAAAFEREFPGKIFRYVDAGDLVPKLPTVSLFTNSYQHCQQEIIVGDAARDGEEVLEKLAAEQAAEQAADEIAPPTADRLWSEIRAGMPSHLMGNYLARLAQDRLA